MRGLKHFDCTAQLPISRVASFTDAWIETMSEGVTDKPETSHLLQMRGLKQLTKAQAEYTEKSHLLQMRGLKRYDALNMPEYLGSHLLQMRGLKPN